MKLIDSNIFLEVLLEQSKSKDCENFLKAIAVSQEQAIITDFLIDTICVILGREGKQPKAISQFLSSLLGFAGLSIYNTTIMDKILAAGLMEKHGLDFDDALVLQAMHVNKIKQIVSYDRHFDKIKDIERTEP